MQKDSARFPGPLWLRLLVAGVAIVPGLLVILVGGMLRIAAGLPLAALRAIAQLFVSMWWFASTVWKDNL